MWHSSRKSDRQQEGRTTYREDLTGERWTGTEFTASVIQGKGLQIARVDEPGQYRLWDTTSSRESLCSCAEGKGSGTMRPDGSLHRRRNYLDGEVEASDIDRHRHLLERRTMEPQGRELAAEEVARTDRRRANESDAGLGGEQNRVGRRGYRLHRDAGAGTRGEERSSSWDRAHSPARRGKSWPEKS